MFSSMFKKPKDHENKHLTSGKIPQSSVPTPPPSAQVTFVEPSRPNLKQMSIASVYNLVSGACDKKTLEQLASRQSELVDYIAANHPEYLSECLDKKTCLGQFFEIDPKMAGLNWLGRKAKKIISDKINKLLTTPQSEERHEAKETLSIYVNGSPVIVQPPLLQFMPGDKMIGSEQFTSFAEETTTKEKVKQLMDDTTQAVNQLAAEARHIIAAGTANEKMRFRYQSKWINYGTFTTLTNIQEGAAQRASENTADAVINYNSNSY